MAGFAEPVSSFTHLAGAAVFLVLTAILVRRAWGSTWQVASTVVFGASTVFLLSMSGVYHLLPESAGKDVLRSLDIAGVFALVAGTFTPVHAILFRGRSRLLPLVAIWSAATAGIALRTLFSGDVPHGVVTGCFLALGWAGVVSGVALWRRAGFACVRPLLWGGVAYTLGAIGLAATWLRPVPGVVEHHELWHLAVLLGLSLHWAFVFRLVPVPPGHYSPRPARQLSAIA
jgi:channel protein (hemolysin III family)